MADDKRGREAQADGADRRQRERDVAAAVERGDEPEPPIEATELEDVEAALEDVSFPSTAAEVVAAVGDRAVESTDGTYAVAELIPASAAETFEAPAAVRERIQRPTVATAMKRVVEAVETLQHTDLTGSQRDGYERTFRELRAIDAVDDDEGIAAIADWIVERIREEETLPGSRAVRRQAAKYCRSQGYQVRTDEWLGV